MFLKRKETHKQIKGLERKSWVKKMATDFYFLLYFYFFPQTSANSIIRKKHLTKIKTMHDYEISSVLTHVIYE